MVACCRSARKKAMSIMSSVESYISSAVTSRATPSAMPSDVAPARSGRRAMWRTVMVVSCDRANGSRRPVKKRR
jgi:hypothetical protein